jgi:hypothetical protein
MIEPLPMHVSAPTHQMPASAKLYICTSSLLIVCFCSSLICRCYGRRTKHASAVSAQYLCLAQVCRHTPQQAHAYSDPAWMHPLAGKHPIKAMLCGCQPTS